VEPELKFQAPAATPKLFGPLKTGKTLYYLHDSLAPQTMAVEPEPKFQAPAPIIQKFVCSQRMSWLIMEHTFALYLQPKCKWFIIS